jgi:hypothetical protein
MEENDDELGYFEISPYFLRLEDYSDESINYSEIKGWVPKEVRKSQIAGLFGPFASDGLNVYKRKNDKPSKYPVIKFVKENDKTNSKLVIIKYDPRTHDAKFALLMNMFTPFKQKNGPTSTRTVRFGFNRYRRVDLNNK